MNAWIINYYVPITMQIFIIDKRELNTVHYYYY